jgi:hypothetical protein
VLALGRTEMMRGTYIPLAGSAERFFFLCHLPDARSIHDASNLTDNFHANGYASTLQSASCLLSFKVAPNGLR